MPARNVPLFQVKMSDRAPDMVAEVLRSGYVGQGKRCDEFEAVMKRHFECDEVLFVNSCTSALHLAAHMIRTSESWEPRYKAVTSPLTCFATQSALLQANIRLKWCDVGRDLNMDLDDVERKLDEDTRILMVVHWGGNPVDMDRVQVIKDKYELCYGKQLHVIEDCAHAWGSRDRGELVGLSGNWAAFSFQAIKSLTTCDGGLLIAPTQPTYRRAKLLRWFGLDRDAGQSFRCVQNLEEWGFKYQPTDVDAAIGLANYPEIAACVERHRVNAAFYNRELAGVPGVELILPRKDSEPSYWLYTMHVEKRDQFVRWMGENGVACSPVHARCDKHSCVQEYRSFLPTVDSVAPTMVCIPVGWWVTDEDRQHVVDCVKKGW